MRRHLVAAFRQGLSETGYVEGRNVAIEYRWAEGQYDRLPALAADLVGRVGRDRRDWRQRSARWRPRRRPRRFRSSSRPAGDPVKLGLVASLNRPGGNVTGVNYSTASLRPKRLELLHELVPGAAVDCAARQPEQSGTERRREMRRTAARTSGCKSLSSMPAPRARSMRPSRRWCKQRAGALVVGWRSILQQPAQQIVALAARHALPGDLLNREFVAAGGLMSYGNEHCRMLSPGRRSTPAAFSRARSRPTCRSMQPTKFELVINLKTAKALGLDVPPTLLAPPTR